MYYKHYPHINTVLDSSHQKQTKVIKIMLALNPNPFIHQQIFNVSANKSLHIQIDNISVIHTPNLSPHDTPINGVLLVSARVMI